MTLGNAENQTPKVLIIDDLPSARKILVKFINNCGSFSILQANNGREAIELITREKVDIIISDWNMPEINGIELVKLLRQNSDFKKTPFLMITCANEANQVQEALSSGVTDYICKPYNLNLLKEKISKYLHPDN